MRNPSGQLVPVSHGTQPSGPQTQKDRPPATNQSSAAGTGCTYRTTNQYFCHAGAYQSLTSGGGYMSTPVQSPWVETGDSHSLAELAVESADARQIIEIGWTVDPTQPTHDQVPRLFIYHWVNGVGTCYNGCGFVPSGSTGITPGMALTASSTPVQFAIQYYQGNWWYGYQGNWFGYLPEASIWGGTFTSAGLVQIFGEVASTTARPCTNMGNGTLGTNAAAAAVTGVGYYNTTSAVNLARGTVDDPTLYDSQVTSTSSFRYGGPGAC
ncbi:MAG TPA: neprosin family prolyl endopeptidase [Jatrophihabitans sp.]|nr:neprosin family prolyl endopeptidase [Jatrophihabitans sp.]